MGKVHQAINKLKRQLNEEPVEFDVDWYNERIVSDMSVYVSRKCVLIDVTERETVGNARA